MYDFNQGKHAPEIIGGDTLTGFTIESVMLGGRLCKPKFELKHLVFVQILGESKHPITRETRTQAIGWGQAAPNIPLVLVLKKSEL